MLIPNITWGCDWDNLDKGLVVPRGRKPNQQRPVLSAFKMLNQPWQVWLNWLGIICVLKGSLFGFQVRTYAQISG